MNDDTTTLKLTEEDKERLQNGESVEWSFADLGIRYTLTAEEIEQTDLEEDPAHE